MQYKLAQALAQVSAVVVLPTRAAPEGDVQAPERETATQGATRQVLNDAT